MEVYTRTCWFPIIDGACCLYCLMWSNKSSSRNVGAYPTLQVLWSLWSFKRLAKTNSIDKKSMENRDSFLRKLFENTAILKRFVVVNFADIIKILSWIFQKSVKVKKITKKLSKCNLYLYFLIYQKLLTFSEKY